LPFDIVIKLCFFVYVLVAILIAQSTEYNVLLKIVIAYLAFEVIAILMGIAWLIVYKVFNGAFFWLIDIVPAHGTNAKEARRIAEGGRISELMLKLEKDLNNWTQEDTDQLGSMLWNWRARLFFGKERKRRLNLNIEHLKTIYDTTGQLTTDSITEALKKYPGGKALWWETVIASPYIFNQIVCLAIIIVVVAH
jgi:hypothetical protein